MYVTAEIPSQTTTPELYKIITQHMIHGPCGPPNPKSPCMEDGKCSKQYPKEFCEKTVQLADGYPKYRRPENGLSVQKNGILLDNRWIVPYKLYLCSKYSAHINVEIGSSVTAVKYLYKYVYKEHDRLWLSFSVMKTMKYSVMLMQDMCLLQRHAGEFFITIFMTDHLLFKDSQYTYLDNIMWSTKKEKQKKPFKILKTQL